MQVLVSITMLAPGLSIRCVGVGVQCTMLIQEEDEWFVERNPLHLTPSLSEAAGQA